MVRRYYLLIGVAVFLLLGAQWLNSTDTGFVGVASTMPETVDFNQHIRPILSANCYVCHGPDVSTREADLRLDDRAVATHPTESGETAIVPGDARGSALIRRTKSDDPDEKMPPAETKRSLSDHEIRLLEKWIDQGATYKPHWSFVPVQQPDIPGGPLYWGEHPVDRFLHQQRRQAGLRTAPKAEKHALIRRLSYVLTGLPPSAEGVKAFEEDNRPEAYADLVDRMLASPHFGERWARHWMDLMRYANTKGHEFDYPVIGADAYRDYLIRAFNSDVSYDQLVLEHFAGDLLTEPRMHPTEGYNESHLGTMFFNLGEGTHSPVDLQIDESIRIDNIIDVSTKTFQGLTVACAKCHDHKFDPIPTTDYYSLYGIVKSTRFAPRQVNNTPALRETARDLVNEKGTLRHTLAETWREAIQEDGRSSYQSLMPTSLEPSRLPGFKRMLGDFRNSDFDNWQVDGPAFGEKPLRGALRFSSDSTAVSQIQSSVATSATSSSRLFGALRSPQFIVEEGDQITVNAAGRGAQIRMILDNFQLIQNPIYGVLSADVNNPSLQTYSFNIGRWHGRQAYVEILPGFYKGQHLFQGDSSYVDVSWAAIHRDSLGLSELPRFTPVRVSAAEAQSAIGRWEEGESTDRDHQILQLLLTLGVLDTPEDLFKPWLASYQALERMLPEPEIVVSMLEGKGTDHPVFVRGNVADPSEQKVPRRFLAVLDSSRQAFGEEGSGRLQFAQKVIEPTNPLTARVMVNRIWHHVFGRGLVESVDNFGVQGKSPSHPELLDFLADQFVASGWSIKKMIRELVLTEAFQLSTQGHGVSERKDPENILVHKYPLRRLEAESIRDGILAVSGRLDPAMYGPSVAVHLSDFMQGRGRPREAGPLDGEGRRSIYLSVRRNFLSPFMLVYDMPIPFSTFGKRNTSNVPAQSLTMMNDPFVQQQASFWASRVVLLKELDTSARISHMYLRAIAREPTNEELEDALEFLAIRAEAYGIELTDLQLDPRPWEDFGHTLFNLKEFIFLV